MFCRIWWTGLTLKWLTVQYSDESVSVHRPLLFILIIMVSAYREKCISLISAVASM